LKESESESDFKFQLKRRKCKVLKKGCKLLSEKLLLVQQDDETLRSVERQLEDILNALNSDMDDNSEDDERSLLKETESDWQGAESSAMT